MQPTVSSDRVAVSCVCLIGVTFLQFLLDNTSDLGQTPQKTKGSGVRGPRDNGKLRKTVF